MTFLIHPQLPQALTTRRLEQSTTIQLWDLHSSTAELMTSITVPHSIDTSATGSDEVAMTYTESPAWADPAFLALRRWNDIHSVMTFPLPSGQVFLQSLAISPDGRLIAIASFDEQICVLERRTGEPLAMLEGGEFISGLTFSPDSSLLAAAHTFQGGGYISVYRIGDGHVDILHKDLDRTSLASPVGDFADTFASMRFSPDGSLLAIYETRDIRDPSWYGDLLLYEIATGKPRWLVPLHKPSHTHQEAEELFWTEVCFEPDGQTVLVGNLEGTIQRFAVTDATLLGTYSFGIHEPVTTFGIEQTHKRLWVLDRTGTLKSCAIC